MYEFKLPDLGEGVHEGEVLKWHVKPGDAIAEDDALVDIETDKAAVSIPSPKSGKVVDLTGDVGDTVYVGNIIAVIETGDGAAAAPAKQAPAAAAPVASVEAEAPPLAAAAAATPAAPPAAPRPGRVVPAAPATRRLAREMGIDISQVAPSGPGGRVTPEDLKAFADGGAPMVAAGGKKTRATAEFAARAASAIPFLDIEPLPDFTQWGPVELEPLRSIRRKVAHKMTTSMILVPHVAHMDDADVTELEEYRAREKERLAGTGQSPPTLLAFVAKAVTAGLMQAPSFNASLDPFEEQIVYKKYYNIGIAVDSGRGLIVPVLKDVDKKSILDIAGDIRDLATRAREGKVEVNELRGGTFTITNVGPLGGTALIPTINYPEVAILGMGKVQEKPVVRKGEIVIRKILPITLAFDHRIADGADAARFVGELIRQLGDPLHWLVSKT